MLYMRHIVVSPSLVKNFNQSTPFTQKFIDQKRSDRASPCIIHYSSTLEEIETIGLLAALIYLSSLEKE